MMILFVSASFKRVSNDLPVKNTILSRCLSNHRNKYELIRRATPPSSNRTRLGVIVSSARD